MELEDGWHSRDQILVNRCGGGCDSVNLCCRPTETLYETFPFVPPGNDTSSGRVREETVRTARGRVHRAHLGDIHAENQ